MTSNEIRNVLILSSDSLSYPYFADQATDLATQIGAVNFRNAIAPASNTRCSAPALHAGVFSDSELLIQSPIRISEGGKLPTVAEQFRDAGYETGFWTPNHIFGTANNYDRGFVHGNKGATQGNKRIADTLKRYGTDWLFDIAQKAYFYAVKPLSGKVQNNSGYVWGPAEKIQRDALNWFETRDEQQTFCWLHYMDTHHPFEPPQKYLDEVDLNENWTREELSFFTRDAIKTNADGLASEEVADVEAAYIASCNYLKDQIEDFISKMRENRHFDPQKDLLCITSDHGTAFSPTKHGLMGHASFFEEIVRVPLVISHPSWEHQTVDEQVSLIDLMPTILSAAGISIPESYEGVPCESPTEMHCEHAYAIDGNPVRRCIRGENKKLFGHRPSENAFEIVLTEFAEGPEVDEEIVRRMTLEEFKRTNADSLPEPYQNLYSQLQNEHGGLFSDAL